MTKPRIIAFYLPQYHSFPENDEWWGKGFTEWTNVGKAKSLFKGHDQPRVPTELGYYDLTMPKIREEQARLAREAGIEGFMYWHYWFGGGRTLLTEIIKEVQESGKPDFPFCIGWANHSWYAKNWNLDGTTSNRLLMEQTYPGIDDAKAYFDSLLPLFRDKRYITVDGSPLLLIYDPESVPEEYMHLFRKWSVENGFPGIFFVAYVGNPRIDGEKYIKKGFDMILYQRLTPPSSKIALKAGVLGKVARHMWRRAAGFLKRRPPFCYRYKDVYPSFVTEMERNVNVAPVILPQWDHSPRSGRNGIILHDSRPEYFYRHAGMAIKAVEAKPAQHQLIFLKSWNEWGEGNYMEPDLTHGRGYIEALRKAVDEA